MSRSNEAAARRTARKRSRGELEFELFEAGAAISRRFDRIERAVKPRRLDSGIAAGRKIAADPKVRIAFFAVGGLVAAWLVGGMIRNAGGRRRRAADLAADVADEAIRRQERGEEPRDAIRRSVRERLLDLGGTDSSAGKGLFSFVFLYAVKAGVQTGIRSLVSRWADEDNGDDPGGSRPTSDVS